MGQSRTELVRTMASGSREEQVLENQINELKETLNKLETKMADQNRDWEAWRVKHEKNNVVVKAMNAMFAMLQQVEKEEFAPEQTGMRLYQCQCLTSLINSRADIH